MILDDGDNIFATGITLSNQPAVVKFSNLGLQSWASVDTAVTATGYLDAAFDHGGNVYLSLDTKFQAADHDFVVLKYALGPVDVHKESEPLPATFRLYDAYPNPFNPKTRIQYAIPFRQQVLLKVFDVLGGEVATLVDVIQEPGVHHADFNAGGLASGVYFYRLQAGPFTGVKKILLMK